MSNLQCLDICCIRDWDVAKAFAELFPGRFRYYGRRHWEFWDHDLRVWVRDKNQRALKSCLRTEFCEHIRERALWWQKNIGELRGVATFDAHGASLTLQRLLDLSLRIQRDDFVRGVINELKGYYEAFDAVVGGAGVGETG